MFQCFVNQNAHVYIKQLTWKKPTQKGEHSCKCTELSLKQKEGIRGMCVGWGGVGVVNWSHQTFYGHLTSQQKQCQYYLNSQAGIQSVF